ncbi:MAG: ECF RNA polymerase sigma factor SigK [Nitriliruptorales bacterium]
MAHDPPPLRAVPSPAPRAGAPTAADLMASVARGDQEAFAAIYDRYADRVFGVIRTVLRDPAMSEEVAQEVFVEAWRTARSFDPERGAVATWLMTLAHRRAVDRVRSEQSSRDREDRVGAQEVTRPFDEVEERVEAVLEREQVRQALEGLTDLQREAIELAYYGGNTYREVAELLDTPLGTVKTRLRDGLIRLRDALGVSS